MKINIVLAPDDNYVPYASVVIKSAVNSSNDSKNLKFWILDGGLSEFSKEILLESGSDIRFLPIDKGLFEGLPSSGYISKSTWYRFIISELMPTDTEKALYLDCDVAVNSDLSELFDMDIKDYAVAAVKDVLYPKFGRAIGMPKRYHYFNAGVLLINLDYWRKNQVAKELFDTVNKSDENKKLMDQNILNIVLKNRYRELPLSYNLQYVPPFLEESFYGKSEFSDAMKKPMIVHFVGLYKPWNSALGMLNPMYNLFSRYMDNPPNYKKGFVKLLFRKILRHPMFFFRKGVLNNILNILCYIYYK